MFVLHRARQLTTCSSVRKRSRWDGRREEGEGEGVSELRVTEGKKRAEKQHGKRVECTLGEDGFQSALIASDPSSFDVDGRAR